MAILYGTQSNGETLPVQVNSFGQLVAQGLDGAKGEKGDKGDQGPQGPQGEPGEPGADASLEVTNWTPSLEFKDKGECLLDVASADGRVYNVGGFYCVTFQIIINDIGIVNPRGYPAVSGFPILSAGASTRPERQMGFAAQTSLFKSASFAFLKNSAGGDNFTFWINNDDGSRRLDTVDLDDAFQGQQFIAGTFFGRPATATEIAEQRAEALREAANS